MRHCAVHRALLGLLVTCTLLCSAACSIGAQPSAPVSSPTSMLTQTAASAPPAGSAPTPAAGATATRSSRRIGGPTPLRRSQSPTSTPLPTLPPSTPTPTTTPSPTAFVQKPTSAFVERPLADLSPDAVAFLAGREGPRGAAVVVPQRATIYTENGDELTPMASVAKVMIMIAVMDRAVREGRDLSAWELSMITPMITVSDNDSASALWADLGGGAAVQQTLRSMGLTASAPNPAEAWGASRSTPKEVALLLTKLALGEILTQPMRDRALALMSAVIPEQTWGVTKGIPTDKPQQAFVAIKDGWLPTQGGWWVNSAGLILPVGDQPAYAMAVLTRQQPSLEYGIATIEGVAERVHAALHAQAAATPSAGR